jgi:hypothetical protein
VEIARQSWLKLKHRLPFFAARSWAGAKLKTLLRWLRRSSDRRWNLSFWFPAASVALVTLLVAGFLTAPGHFGEKHQPEQIAVTSPADATVSDAALMDQVDAAVSETVPSAMAPLTDLVAWDSEEESTIGGSAEEKGLHKKSDAVAVEKERAPVTD